MPAFGSVISRFSDRGLNGSLGQRYFTQGASALLGLGMLLSSTAANADVVPDGSTNSALSNSPITCLGSSPCISGGDRQGDNLFHSFREFTIDAGETVYLGRFASPLDLLRIGPDLANIDKIFIRVVGSPTDIQGTLEAVNLLASPYDVIFLSPQGITIGDGAELRYPGNFLFSTAERLDFSSGGVFDATDNSIPLLTVSGLNGLPSALQLGNSPGAIDFTNSSSTVQESIEISQTQHQFAVVGEKINFENVEISTPGNLTLLSINENQTIDLDVVSSNNGIIFSYAASVDLDDIDLRNSALLINSFSSSDDAGTIEILGDDLRLLQNSQIRTVTDVEGGDIRLFLSDNIDLEDSSQISSGANTPSATAGEISIESNDVRLVQNSLINSSTATTGGNITLDVAGQVELDSQSQILTQATTSTGNAGNITVSTGRLSLLDQSRISTQTNSAGGDVLLTVSGGIF